MNQYAALIKSAKWTDYELNAIAKHLAYEISELESDVISDPQKLENIIQEKLTEFLR